LLTVLPLSTFAYLTQPIVMQTSLSSRHSVPSHSASQRIQSPLLDSALARVIQAGLFLVLMWAVTGYVMGWFPGVSTLVSGMTL